MAGQLGCVSILAITNKTAIKIVKKKKKIQKTKTQTNNEAFYIHPSQVDLAQIDWYVVNFSHRFIER